VVCVPRALLWAAALIAIGVLAASCGGASPNRTGSRPSEPQVRKQMLAYAACMRSHEVPDYPDPQVSMGPDGVRVTISPGAADPTTPAFRSADRACRGRLPQGFANGAAVSTPRQQARALMFAHCMRSHGVPSFPDPDRHGDFTLPAGIDQQAPQFQHAMHACAQVKPASLLINPS
jgi:hypothetical protein